MYINDKDEAENVAKVKRIFEQEREHLMMNALKVLRSGNLAEDAIQESFVCILEHLDKFVTMSEEEQYLYVCRTVENACLDMNRGNSKCFPNSDLTIANLEPVSSAEMAYLYGQDGIIQTLQERLAPYPGIDIKLMILHESGYTYDEISRLTGVSEETLRKRSQRSRERIRKLLDQGLFRDFFFML